MSAATIQTVQSTASVSTRLTIIGQVANTALYELPVDLTAGGTGEQEAPPDPKAKGNNLRKHLDMIRKGKYYGDEQVVEPSENPLLEHDPEWDTVRGLNEREREELMAIFKRKERSTISAIK